MKLKLVAESTDQYVSVLATDAKMTAAWALAEHLKVMRRGALDAATLCANVSYRLEKWQEVAMDLGGTDQPLDGTERIIGGRHTQMLRSILGHADSIVKALEMDKTGATKDPELSQRSMERIAEQAQPLAEHLDALWRHYVAQAYELRQKLLEAPKGVDVQVHARQAGEILSSQE